MVTATQSPAAQAPKAATAPQAAPAKASGIHGTITVLVAANPKAKGSKAYARFALYTNGMHTNAYRALPSVGKQYGGPDLLYDTRHGYIKVA